MEREQFNEVTLTEMIRAGLGLGLARLTLRSKISVTLAAADRAQSSSPLQDSRQRDFVKRVSYIIPRVAARLPWRADCLVQALAAKQWLHSRGIASILELGIPREPPPEFQAHAWLRAGDIVVTGGDVSGYVPFRRRCSISDSNVIKQSVYDGQRSPRAAQASVKD